MDVKYDLVSSEEDVVSRVDVQEEVDGDGDGESEALCRRGTLASIVTRALPVCVTFLLGIGVNFVTLYFAGHLSKTTSDTSTFAGVSMAILFSNISCISIIIGMTGAVETLGSQHYGAKNYREVGIVLQRSVVVLSLMVVPGFMMWCFVDKIFLMLGVASDICHVMKKFLLIRAFAIPTDVVSVSYEKYLMSMGVMHPSMYGTILVNILLVCIDSLFVHGFGWGYESLAWAFVLSRYVSDTTVILISWNNPAVILTRQMPHPDALNNIYEFIKLGLPACAMLCSEWWAFEILVIFASQLGSDEVSAQTIISQIGTVAFMIPLSIGIASSSLIGNSLGANKPHLAKYIARIALQSLCLIELFISPCIVLFAPAFVRIFSSSPSVIDIVVKASYLLSVFTFADGLQAVSSGILRGAGKQFYGAYTNVFSYYAVGLPLAWLLCFHSSWGVLGLMGGLAFGTLLQSITLLLLILCRSDKIFIPSEHVKAVALENVGPWCHSKDVEMSMETKPIT